MATIHQKTKTDIDYTFLSKSTQKQLELFFINTDLTQAQRNQIVDLLIKAFEHGQAKAALRF